MTREALIHELVTVIDIVGTFAFALSGAAAGVKRKLDLFGILVLAFAAATAGGIARDVLIGAVPPAALSDWRYLATAVFAGAITFASYGLIDRIRNPVLLFDALGLALFAVSGTQKALAYRLSPVMAALAGAVVVVAGEMLHSPSALTSFVGAASCFTVRMLAIRYHLHLPTAQTFSRRERESTKPDRH